MAAVWDSSPLEKCLFEAQTGCFALLGPRGLQTTPGLLVPQNHILKGFTIPPRLIFLSSEALSWPLEGGRRIVVSVAEAFVCEQGFIRENKLLS